MRHTLTFTIFLLLAGTAGAKALPVLEELDTPSSVYESRAADPPELRFDPQRVLSDREYAKEARKQGLTLYDFPYSRTLSMPNWKQLWINTGVLMGGGITTMVILESLPEDATAWNKTANKKTPLFKRYWKHIKQGPVWDGDKFIFNFILHPYGGAAYYMSARSCGFNTWGSFLYSFCISTFFWEYGFEAFNEIPSVQDLVITPGVGSVVGECFYKLKRHIVSNGYRLWGSPVLGYFVAFLCDPVNELVGYFKRTQYNIYKRHNAAVAGSRTEVSSGFSMSPTGLCGLAPMLNVRINF